MAEGLMKDALKSLGKEGIKVNSAGINAVDGFYPTHETVEAMKRNGTDVSGVRSRYLTDDMIKDSDLILVMASHHMNDILKRIPQAASKTHILKRYGRTDDSNACEDPDVSDPIGKPMEVYERTLDDIKREVNRIALSL
jgi:protein-tyrosine-phosphatase